MLDISSIEILILYYAQLNYERGSFFYKKFENSYFVPKKSCFVFFNI